MCVCLKNRIIVGRYEEVECFKTNLQASSRNIGIDDAENSKDIQRSSSQNYKFSILQKSFEAYKCIIDTLKAQSKHISCPHPYSCAHYILMVRYIFRNILKVNIHQNLSLISFYSKDSARIFSYGVCGQIAFKLIFQFKRLLQKPKLLKMTIFQRENLNLAIFLGGFAGLYRVYVLLCIFIYETWKTLINSNKFV